MARLGAVIYSLPEPGADANQARTRPSTAASAAAVEVPVVGVADLHCRLTRAAIHEICLMTQRIDHPAGTDWGLVGPPLGQRLQQMRLADVTCSSGLGLGRRTSHRLIVAASVNTFDSSSDCCRESTAVSPLRDSNADLDDNLMTQSIIDLHMAEYSPNVNFNILDIGLVYSLLVALILVATRLGMLRNPC